MNPNSASRSTQFKVGIFTLLGLLLIGGISVYVNHRPFWWRPCQLVKINVDDATGLKTKSPIRSLGLEIGFLDSVDLKETHVTLAICITAPVQVLPATRAYIRGEGFLGDKFVELKPVKYIGSYPGGKNQEDDEDDSAVPAVAPVATPTQHSKAGPLRIMDWLIPAAHAESLVEENADAADPEPTPSKAPVVRSAQGGGREIPVGENSQDIQALVSKVDGLVGEMTGLTKNLREGISPDELRQTLRQLNKTLENASKTLSPEGGLNQTAQRTLAKLEDAIEQLRDMMTRINKGEGSLGMLLNDPVYAEEIKKALKNVNKILNKVGDFRFQVDIYVQQLNAFSGTRGGGTIAIWPDNTRYYLLGASSDPRGNTTITQTQTVAGSVSTSTTTTQTAENSIRITGMLGKTYLRNRLDFSVGFLYGDGCVSVKTNIGPSDHVEWAYLRDDVYGLQNNGGIADRLSAVVHPIPYFRTIYLSAAMEDFRKVNGHYNFFYGAGVSFDDDDIKLLFTLK
jgi:phospholipid/cholesterol/gamma-HCH transport system substrate-binding protein